MYWPTDFLSVETWALLATIVGLIWYYIHTKWQYLAKLNMPHDPPSLSNFGNAVKLFKDFSKDNDQKKKFGPIWGFYFLFDPSIIVHDVDILRKIFIKEFASFPLRQDRLDKIFGPELGAGLTVAKGHQWKRLRSTMSPTFSTSKIKEMTGIIEWCADNAVAALERKNENGDGTFNPKETFSRLSLDIVCSAAFSTKVHSQDETQKDPEIVVHAKKIFGTPMFSPLFFLCFVFPVFETILTKLGVNIMPKDSKQYFINLVNYMIEEREKNKGSQRVDLLQLMLDSEITQKESESQEKKGMTRLEIIGNSMTMIMAGYENTSNTLLFLAYNLAINPEIQSKVQEEIDEMMETKGKFDNDGVNSLKYLDMCLNESLRLYTPLIRNSRICTNETTINGVTFPKGISIGIPVYALAHDPDYWDQPYEFRPERMRDMNEIDQIMFQPFGVGPRNCIGIRFAMIEVKISLCKILYHFTLKPSENTPDPPLKLKFGSSIRPEVDFNLIAVPRNRGK